MFVVVNYERPLGGRVCSWISYRLLRTKTDTKRTPNTSEKLNGYSFSTGRNLIFPTDRRACRKCFWGCQGLHFAYLQVERHTHLPGVESHRPLHRSTDTESILRSYSRLFKLCAPIGTVLFPVCLHIRHRSPIIRLLTVSCLLPARRTGGKFNQQTDEQGCNEGPGRIRMRGISLAQILGSMPSHSRGRQGELRAAIAWQRSPT